MTNFTLGVFVSLSSILCLYLFPHWVVFWQAWIAWMLQASGRVYFLLIYARLLLYSLLEIGACFFLLKLVYLRFLVVIYLRFFELIYFLLLKVI